MGRRRCCCGICWSFLDNFNRTPSDDIGPNWHEELGEWDIIGSAEEGWLHEKHDGGGTANATVICTRPVPLHSAGEMSISVWFCDPQTGDINYIYPACIDESTHGPCVVKFECTTAPARWTVTVLLSGTSIGTRDYVAAVDNTTNYPSVGATVCVDDHDAPEIHMIKAYMPNSAGTEPIWIDNNDAGDGRYAGLGHDNPTTGVIFNNFALYELRLANGTMCVDCFCNCLGHPPQKALHAVYHDATYRAACMEGVGWDMDWEWTTGVGSWHGHVTVPATAEGGLATEFAYVLTCAEADDNDPTWPGKNFDLSMPMGVWCGTDGSAAREPVAELSTCDPFSLTFGPYHLSARDDLMCNVCLPIGTPSDCYGLTPSDLCFGEFYIVITEA
jgi:hypothetical protein